jgi:ABC-2 type transport system permease protein
MRLIFAYARTQTLELLRIPGFSIATLAFPSLFFLLFGLPQADRHPEQLLAAYAAFAVLGVGFFQFGVSAAIERVTPWATFVRTLPAPVLTRIVGRVLSALVFALAAVGALVALALATTETSLSQGQWLRLGVALLAGSVPFVMLGIGIAYWTSPKSALPVANILYMLLSYAGGLWTGPHGLPHVVERVSPYTPTRQWGDVLWPAVAGSAWSGRHWLALLAYTALFGAVAVWGYRRDEGQRFR